MNVIVLQVFVSLMLVAAAILAFAYSVRQADHEHADRLSLLPIEDEGAHGTSRSTSPGGSTEKTPSA